MADEVVGLRIEVDSNAGEAVGSLRSQLKAAQAEVAAMAEKFGVTSKEAADAAKKAAELKDKIGDAKALTDAFNPDAKFKALSASLSGVAGGFAAVQGAMGLFGTESKELEKQLLKVQSAMALSQGLQTLGEAKDSFIQLAAVIKAQVISAFSTLRGAIIATGIGALAVGLGLVIANFEAFKKAVYNLLPGLETVVKYIGVLVTKMTDFVGITSEADRQLEKLNKTTDKYGAQLEREIALLKARGDEVGAFNKQREKLEGDLAQARANYGKNNEKEWGKIILDTKNALEILKIEEQKYLDEQKAKRDEKNKERLDKEKEHKEAIFNINKTYKESQKKYDEEFLEELNKQDEEEKKKQEESKQNIEQYNAEQFTRYIENKRAQYKLEIDYNNALIDAEKALQSAKYDAAQAGLNALNELAQGNKELANIIFIADKALAIARVVVNLQSEISAYAANPTWSLAPDGGLAIKSANIAAAKIRAGINIATIAATTIGKFMNNSGSGASGGSAGSGGGGYSFSAGGTAPISPQTNVVTTQLTNQNLNELKNNTVRAYVVESDVTDNQNRIRRIQEAAEFGG